MHSVRLCSHLGSHTRTCGLDRMCGRREVRLASRSYPRGPDDICLGTVGGVEFLIDRVHDLALGCPDFHVDVTPTRLEDDEAGVRAQYHLVSRASRRN